jgi:ABC-2 type transport system ATP-binding protein
VDILTATDVTKQYGAATVLDHLNFSIHQGEILGVLGKNGAGKTTLIKILLNLIDKSSGTVVYHFANGDVPYGSRALYRHASAVLESVDNLYDYLTGWQNIQYFTELNGQNFKAVAPTATNLLTRFDLLADANKRVGHYSRGMKQKLAIVCCLLADTELIFLDEPTLGLDFMASHTLITQIKAINQELGKTIVLTSHQAYVLAQLVDRILLIDQHQIRYLGTYADFRQGYVAFPFYIEFALTAPPTPPANGRVAAADPASWRAEFTDSASQIAYLKLLIQADAQITQVGQTETSLDDILQSIFAESEGKS